MMLFLINEGFDKKLNDSWPLSHGAGGVIISDSMSF
jgi:hypothetical protein